MYPRVPLINDDTKIVEDSDTGIGWRFVEYEEDDQIRISVPRSLYSPNALETRRNVCELRQLFRWYKRNLDNRVRRIVDGDRSVAWVPVPDRRSVRRLKRFVPCIVGAQGPSERPSIIEAMLSQLMGVVATFDATRPTWEQRSSLGKMSFFDASKLSLGRPTSPRPPCSELYRTALAVCVSSLI